MWCANDSSLPGLRRAASVTLTIPGDMLGKNRCSITWFLPKVRTDTGTRIAPGHGHPPLSRFPRPCAFALMGPVPLVPHLHSSYAALRLPNVHRPYIFGSGSPCLLAYLVAGVFFLAGHLRAPARRRTVGEFGYGSPWAVLSLGDVRASQVLGPSSTYAPKTNTPSRPSATHPSRRFGSVFSPAKGLDVWN